MKYLLLFIVFSSPFLLDAQSKKQQIKTLNIAIDSLNNALINERNNNIAELSKKDQIIAKYNYQIISFKNEIQLKNNNINKLIEDSLNNDILINNLRFEIKLLKDTLKNISDAILKKPNLFGPIGKIEDPNNRDIYLHTVILNSDNESYIIIDSIFSTIGNQDFYFYFLTPIEYIDQLQCPYEYGVIVLDDEKNEIFNLFWDMSSTNEYKIIGNCLPKLYQFNTNKGIRNLLHLGNSGCGSGIGSVYYEINFTDKSMKFEPKLNGSIPLSDYLFLQDKNLYIKVERLDPECRYSCPSKYRISSFSLTTDILVKTSLTKLMYDDFNDIGIENLLNNVKIKEKIIFY